MVDAKKGAQLAIGDGPSISRPFGKNGPCSIGSLSLIDGHGRRAPMKRNIADKTASKRDMRQSDNLDASHTLLKVQAVIFGIPGQCRVIAWELKLSGIVPLSEWNSNHGRPLLVADSSAWL
jgi:hypothetical protein